MDSNNNPSAGANTTPPAKKENNTLMGVLAYIGPLVIVSYLVSKNDPFVKFHIKQGLVLLVLGVIFWALSPMFYGFWILMRVVNLAVTVLAIIGIVNVVQGKEKELPLVGPFAKYFTF